jgi:hypothetical protein
MKRFLPLFLAVTALVAATSCTLNQRIYLEPSGAGNVSLHIKLDKIFMDYITDLSQLTGKDTAQGQVFNVEDIKKQFAQRKDVKLTRIQSPSPDVLDMDLSFSSVDRVFSEEQLKEAGIISFGRSPAGTSLRFHLDRSNFNQVSSFLPFLQNPLFQGLGPQENDTTTEAEYLEMIDLALGDGGAKSLQNSYVVTEVTVKGKIVSQTGGTLTQGGVTYKTPLIRVLLLDKPLDYTLVFK